MFGAGIVLILWFGVQQPLLSIIMVVIIDALGFFPTFRKSFHKPHEETLITFMFSSLKFVIGLFALESYSLITWLYPTYLVFANGIFVLMLIIRRRRKKLDTAS